MARNSSTASSLAVASSLEQRSSTETKNESRPLSTARKNESRLTLLYIASRGNFLFADFVLF